MEYQVVYCGSIEELIHNVNKEMKEWYIPQWGITLQTWSVGTFYYQAMIKENKT